MSVVIGRFQSISFVSVFQGIHITLHYITLLHIAIDGSKKRNQQLGFELQSSNVIERHDNVCNNK